MADNKIDVGGRLHSIATGNVLAGANEILDDSKGKKQSEINTDVDNALANRYTKDETYNKNELNSLITTPDVQYITVSTYSQLPATGSANTIYKVSSYDGTAVDATKYAEYAWDGSSYVLLSVKSAVDEIFDISVFNAESGIAKKYESLTAALAGIPSNRQKGGITVKFIQSSDNKYVQYRLMSDSWSTNTDDWAVADESVYVDNPEFIYVKTDTEDKILWAIKTDGSIYYGVGVPPQVIDYINEKIEELSLDEYEDIVAFLNSLEEGDKTLQTLLNEKVDKEEGKNLIDAEFAEGVSQVENPEFAEVHTDAEDKVLYGVKKNGDFYFGDGVPYQIQEELDNKANLVDLDEVSAEVTEIDANKVDKEEGKSLIDADYASSQSAIDNPEYLQVTTDSEDKILEAITAEGVKQINLPIDTLNATFGHVDNPEWITVTTDVDGKILEGFNKNGKKVIPELESKSLNEKIEDLNNDLQTSIDSVYTQNIPQPAMVRFDIDHIMKDFTEFHNNFSIVPATTIAERIYHLYDELAALYPDYVKKYDPMADTDTNQTVVIDGVSYNITVYGMSSIKSAMSEAGFSDYPVYAKGVTDDIQETVHNIDGTSYTVTYTQTPAYRTYMYAFVCGIDYINTDINKKHKIMVTSNLHGNEIAAVVNLYLLIKQLCDGVVDDGNFYKLRAAFDIYVIPSVNQYGNYHNTRCNARRVDLNRNFPIKNWYISGFDTINNDNRCVFTGPNAGSEFETQLVIALSNYIQPVWAFDHHNYGEGTGGVYTGIVNHNGVLLTKLAQQAAVDIAIADAKNYPEYFGKAYHDVLFGATVDAPGHNASINLGRIHCWWAENMAKMAGVIEVGSTISWSNGEQVTEYNWMEKEVLSINEYIVRIQWLKYLQFLMDNYEFI